MSSPARSTEPGGARRRPRPPLPTGTKVLLGALLSVPVDVGDEGVVEELEPAVEPSDGTGR
ncbi:hypothetical protein BH20ACT6_BH20ACT6_12760 [soil metagenome]